MPEATRTGWHDTSATLGAPGNTVINGHNWPQDGVFRDLYQIEIGALIVLYGGEKTFGYEVVEAIIVKEAGQPLEVRQTNARYLMPTQDERVTLVTCHPYGSRRNRLIVTARPVAPLPEDGDPFDAGLAYWVGVKRQSEMDLGDNWERRGCRSFGAAHGVWILHAQQAPSLRELVRVAETAKVHFRDWTTKCH